MLSRSELRQKARFTLGNGIFKPEWIFALLVSLIVSAVLGVLGFTFILAFILVGPIMYAHNKYYLGISRRTIKYDNLSVLLDDAKDNLACNIVLGLLLSLYTFLWSLLFVIPGIVKSYSYSMAYYIKCDHPEYDYTRCIDESKRIMNGNKWRLFLLDLSFIGWIIVGSICFGIGILWVQAYMQATRAEFYRDIIGEKDDVISQDKPEEEPFVELK